MVTAKQKLIVDTQNIRRKEFKHITENDHIPKKDGERGENNKRSMVSLYLSMIALNVNGLNYAIERHGVVGWIEKQESGLCWPRDTHASFMGSRGPKAKRWKKVFQANGTEKKARVATLREKKL